MRKVKVAAIQMSMTSSVEENIAKAERMVREAASKGANIILLPELFERPYFCQERCYEYYAFATPVNENPAVIHFKEVCKELEIVMPISFYEKDGNVLYNTIAMIDADGEVMGIYRKTHIPDDHYYQEKFYFTPGNTGFKVWDTRYGKVGVGICWDQWFPETARCMAIKGAEILLYPTAIGSEPILTVDSMEHWRICMRGHAGSNVVPVVAANRVGIEEVKPSTENGGQESSLKFFGSSFICDERGALVEDASRDKEEILVAEFDLDEVNESRLGWGLFRDRRPSTYGNIVE